MPKAHAIHPHPTQPSACPSLRDDGLTGENQTAGSTQETGNGSGNQTATAGTGAGYPDRLPGSDSQTRGKAPQIITPTRKPRQKPPDHNPTEHYTNPIQKKA